MLNADDYFVKKRLKLGMDRGETLAQTQALLDGWYPGQARAKSLNNDVLTIVTPSSVVASELRLRQVELLQAIARLGLTNVRLAILIQS